MLDTAGFYVGAERTVPIDRATLASWLTVEPAERGTFEISADASAIQPFVDGLPAAVNRAPVDSTTIVNASGRVLSTPTVGVVGRALDTTDGIANAYAEQLAAGNAAYALPVTEVPFNTTSLARLLEVDLSEQRLYVKENGDVVDSWLISSGKTNHADHAGPLHDQLQDDRADDERLRPRCRGQHHGHLLDARTSSGRCTSTAARRSTACTGTTTTATG